jgi:hypothetical protein
LLEQHRADQPDDRGGPGLGRPTGRGHPSISAIRWNIPHAPREPLQAIHCVVEGMDAKRSAAVLLSSPTAAQRCAEGAGLDSGAAAAAQSAMPSITASSHTDCK